MLPLRALQVIILATTAGVSADSRIWISKADGLRDESSSSLEAQALVVKDEEVVAACKAATRNDVRYSTKRYLMCAGSILTGRYVLTSASCIHEATHIRHNVRAPLAVMIAPFSETAQVVKVAGYSIHPRHLVDLRDEHYAQHNVAVVKLACRISQPNLHVIQLPTQPFVDYCSKDHCKVAVIKKIGPMSFVMFEVPADNIGTAKTKRELLVVSERKNPNETVNEPRFNNHDIKKVLRSNENSAGDARIIGSAARATNENPSKNNEKKSIDNSNKRLFIRKSDGTNGCPQKGSAVMSNRVQLAMVAVSCDDRQPEKPWQYTDLYDNLDWINEMIGNSKPTKASPTSATCTTCTYNFFINNYNCKNGALCLKNLHSTKIPARLVPKCSRNHTRFEMPFAHNHSKTNDSQLANRAYLDAINNFHLNKHNHHDENDNKPSPDSVVTTEKSQKNSDPRVDETVKLRLFSQSPSTDFNAAAKHEQRYWSAEKTLVLDYKDNQGDLDSNYRKVKATYDNDNKPRDYADGNEYPEGENRDYQPRYNQIKKPGVAISDRNPVESLPKEFAELYKKFLEEYKQSNVKVNKNVVRRAD